MQNYCGMMRRALPLLLLTLAIFLSLSIDARAQFETATVLGTVRDVNEAVAAGATLTLTNIETGIVSTTTADEGGDYQFTGVKIGVYKVAGTREGFSTTIVENVRVVVNARQRVDLVLQPELPRKSSSPARRSCSNQNRACAAKSSTGSRSSTYP